MAKRLGTLAVTITLLQALAMGQNPPTTNPADPFDSSETRRASEFPTVQPDDLIHYSLMNGFVLAQTTVKPGDAELVTVPPYSTPVKVTIIQRGAAPGEKLYTPDAMTLIHVEQSLNSEVHTSVQKAVDSLNISHDADANGSESSIQYIQTGIPSEDGNQVKLYIQNLSNPEDKQKYDAENFTALLRRYPEECTRYVRPMIEHFSPQPQLFMVDDALGSSVFPEAYQAETSVREKIMRLVKDLDADSFQKRQQASKELKQMGASALPVLTQLDRTKLQPEQATRIESILASVKPPFDVKPQILRSDVSFLLDCMMSPNPSLRKTAMAQLQHVKSGNIAFSDPADEKARVREVYALREQLLNVPTTQPATRP